jgi:hypothetical protein
MSGETFPLVLAGGNLTHEGSNLAKTLTEKVKSAFPQVNVVYPSVNPAVAAGLLVLNKIQG